MNNETRILLQFCDFRGKNVDEAWCLLEWVAWNLFEFEKASCAYFITHLHSMLDHTMLLFGVICVILLPIMLVHVLMMHAILILIHLYL